MKSRLSSLAFLGLFLSYSAFASDDLLLRRTHQTSLMSPMPPIRTQCEVHEKSILYTQFALKQVEDHMEWVVSNVHQAPNISAMNLKEAISRAASGPMETNFDLPYDIDFLEDEAFRADEEGKLASVLLYRRTPDREQTINHSREAQDLRGQLDLYCHF